jgi:hypothetical protein
MSPEVPENRKRSPRAAAEDIAPEGAGTEFDVNENARDL